MKSGSLLLALGLIFLFAPNARASALQGWSVTSPDHAQTFAYGSESRRQWSSRGNPRHLMLFLDYTNDPFVDRSNPRQYDSFSFDFPNVTLEPDGRTFAYRAPNGKTRAVAVKKSGFLGIEEIELLPGSELLVDLPHGHITVTLRGAE